MTAVLKIEHFTDPQALATLRTELRAQGALPFDFESLPIQQLIDLGGTIADAEERAIQHMALKALKYPDRFPINWLEPSLMADVLDRMHNRKFFDMGRLDTPFNVGPGRPIYAQGFGFEAKQGINSIQESLLKIIKRIQSETITSHSSSNSDTLRALLAKCLEISDRITNTTTGQAPAP